MRRAREQLEVGDACAPQLIGVVDHPRPGMGDKPEVDERPALEVSTFRRKVSRGAHRLRMSVLKDCGDTVDRRSGRARRKVLPGGIAGIHEVGVRLHHPGHDE